ncbi:hypothetical protein BV22DRAFT_1052631, partial [Leucogyrophana mollusca]
SSALIHIDIGQAVKSFKRIRKKTSTYSWYNSYVGMFHAAVGASTNTTITAGDRVAQQAVGPNTPVGAELNRAIYYVCSPTSLRDFHRRPLRITIRAWHDRKTTRTKAPSHAGRLFGLDISP